MERRFGGTFRRDESIEQIARYAFAQGDLFAPEEAEDDGTEECGFACGAQDWRASGGEGLS